MKKRRNEAKIYIMYICFFITSKCVKFNFDSFRFNLFSSMLFLFDYVHMRNVSFWFVLILFVWFHFGSIFTGTCIQTTEKLYHYTYIIAAEH
jgi:hypothetical protein